MWLRNGLIFYNVPFKLIEEGNIIGDIIIGDLCIERKTYQDFLNSVYDGRIWEQLNNLSQYSRSLILVHNYKKRMIKREKRVLRSVAVTILMKYPRTNLIMLPFDFEVVLFIRDIYRSMIRNKKSLKPSVKYKKEREISVIQEDVLCAIPLVGRSLARRILLGCGNILAISQEKLEQIKGIGKKRIELIMKILGGEYEI